MHDDRFRAKFSRTVATIFVSGFFVIGLAVVGASGILAADEWTDYENYEVIAHDTTWSESFAQADIEKPVAVVDGATLTIEKGTRVTVANLAVYDGRIVADGTEDEKIVFTKPEPDWSRLPPEFEQYDRECFLYRIPEGTVEFDDWVETGAEESSIFRHVVFDGMGSSVRNSGENCPSEVSRAGIRSFFVRTAFAASPIVRDTPAIRYHSGKVDIVDSSFRNGVYADIEVDPYFLWDDPSFDYLHVADSNFVGNSGHIALISNVTPDHDYSGRIRLVNDWYGSTDGPTAVENPTGTGERLIGMYHLDGWSATEHGLSTVCADCASNVMFLPGLEASRLYMSGSPDNPYQLWEPYGDDEMARLRLNEDGESVHSNIYAKNVIDTAYLPIKGDIYDSFIEDMNGMKEDGTIADWKPIAYDWRLSLEDIVDNGETMEGGVSYTDPAPTSYIISELERLAASSKTGKATIIAHSNGGLVAKALIRALGSEKASRLIDRLVLVAVPQTGTPQAIGAILHGYEQGLPIDWMPFFLSPKAARGMANNMPGAYHLLPSDAYFSGEGSGVETPVIRFDDDGEATRAFIGTYGGEIGDADELRNFLADDEWKVAPDSDDLTSPATTNDALVRYGDDEHNSLDDMAIPESIEAHQIAGFGEETLGTIRYWTESWCALAKADDGSCIRLESRLAYTPEEMVDGDGTVVSPSALAMSTDAPNVKRYWVDLDDYNNDFPSSLSHPDRKHADILEVSELRDFIRNNIITHSATTFPDYISDSRPPTDSEKRLRFYLHSPLALSAHDDLGNVVNADVSDIPGARYRRFGEVQYLSIPASAHPTVKLSGEAAGSFTLEVREMDGETVDAETVYTGIPNTAKTRVAMDFPDGTLANAEPLTIDYDGDGETEHELVPVIGETVTLIADTVAPETIATLSGPAGANGWYVGDATATLSASDEEGGSGVGKTEYSLDDGATWSAYTEPIAFSAEGISALAYRSIDKAGNVEETKSVEVKLDKTAPEAKISFDPETRALDIQGTDDTSGNVSISTTDSVIVIPAPEPESRKSLWRIFERFFKKKEEQKKYFTTATFADEAGHTTTLVFEKVKDLDGFIFVGVRSIAYDGGDPIPLDASIQYKWQTDKKGTYRLLASYLRSGGSAIESHYIPGRNETWLMERSRELRDDDRDDGADRRPKRTKLPGMVVPYLWIGKGDISAKY